MLIYKKLEYCPVTRTQSNIIYPYIDSEDNSWYSVYGGLHSGVDIDAESIHSICQGVVIFVGNDSEDNVSITIQYDASQCIRYCHLSKSYVSSGDLIENGQLIGEADKFVRFEYCNKTKDNSIWSVRISNLTFYKHNPESYADGSIELSNDGVTIVTEITSDMEFPEMIFTEAMSEEFTGNRGKDEVPNSV